MVIAMWLCDCLYVTCSEVNSHVCNVDTHIKVQPGVDQKVRLKLPKPYYL